MTIDGRSPLGSFARTATLACSLLAFSACSATHQSAPSSASATAPSAPPAASALQAPSPPAAPTSTAPASSAMAAAPSGEHLVGEGSETVITIHGRIVAVNRTKKQVTLEGPDGKRVSIHVYNPYNLAAAKPGEPFVAKFYEIVTIVKTSPGVVTPSASVANGIYSASPGQRPGAVVSRGVQLIVTVDSVDEAKGTVSVKGADGKVETVSVANPKNLQHLKPGDGVVVTLWNVVAIALEKESAA